MSEANITTTPSGLKYEEVKVGTGDAATAGKTVSVHYTGWLTNGTKFDSSKDRGQPFEFPLGGGRVIKGWDEGRAGHESGRRAQAHDPAGARLRPARRRAASFRRTPRSCSKSSF